MRRAVMLIAVLAACDSRLAHALPAPAMGAFFHATLRSSSPAAGSTLDRAPTEIRLVFSEEVEPSLGSIRLVGPDGRATRLAAAGDPRDVSALVAPVPAGLASGTYRVEWRIVSEDGHPIDGTFEFALAARSNSTTARGSPRAWSSLPTAAIRSCASWPASPRASATTRNAPSLRTS